MVNNTDPYHLKTNIPAVALVVLIVLLLVDIVFRVTPGVFGIRETGRHPVSAVGYHHQFPDGSWYYVYTVFEDNGDVFQVWWDGNEWRQQKVTNYRLGAQAR
jgi:hypothetical protein